MPASLLLLIFLLLPGLRAAPPAAPSPAVLGAILDEIGISAPAWKEARVVKSLRREGRRHLFWTVAAQSDSRTLRLEITSNVGAAAAQRLVDDRTVRVLALFKPAATDYFGVVQGRTEAPEELRPRTLYPEKTLLRSGNPVLVLWANKELGYVVKAKEDAAYRGLLAFRYCEDRKMFLQVETFEAPARFDETAALREIAAFRCAP